MAVITVRQALNDAFKEEMKIDPTIIMMGCDCMARTASSIRPFPNRLL